MKIKMEWIAQSLPTISVQTKETNNRNGINSIQSKENLKIKQSYSLYLKQQHVASVIAANFEKLSPGCRG